MPVSAERQGHSGSGSNCHTGATAGGDWQGAGHSVGHTGGHLEASPTAGFASRAPQQELVVRERVKQGIAEPLANISSLMGFEDPGPTSDLRNVKRK